MSSPIFECGMGCPRLIPLLIKAALVFRPSLIEKTFIKKRIVGCFKILHSFARPTLLIYPSAMPGRPWRVLVVSARERWIRELRSILEKVIVSWGSQCIGYVRTGRDSCSCIEQRNRFQVDKNSGGSMYGHVVCVEKQWSRSLGC